MRDLIQNVGNVLTIQHQTCVDEIFKCTIFVGYGGVIFFYRCSTFSRTRRPMILKLGMKHQAMELYKVYINHDPGMTLTFFTGPDSSSGRASASGSGGRRFDPRPRHTKGVKNGTGSSLADARNKRVVPGRYQKAGKYLLRNLLLCHIIAHELMSVENATLNKASLSLSK